MEIVDSQVESTIVDDIFIEVCKYFDLKELLRLQLLSKYKSELIRKTRWNHTDVKLYNTDGIDDKIIYLATNFNFMRYNLSYCYRITDEAVKMLGNCHTLYLSECNMITDEAVKMLVNCNALDLS